MISEDNFAEPFRPPNVVPNKLCLPKGI